MDDGNPFNDAHETEETGFGPNYFYDDDEARALSNQWLRNDPQGLRSEEAWDADCFQVEKETADDRAMINDDEEAIQREEMEAENSNESDSGEDRMHEDSSDSGQANGIDESKLELDDFLEVTLVDLNEAIRSLGPGPRSVLDYMLDPFEGSDRHSDTLGHWAAMLDMSVHEVYRAAKELVGLGIVSMACY